MIYSLERNPPQIFTTGAFLRPLKAQDGNGKEFWVWYVERFEEDSFYDGKIFNPVTVAQNLEDLSTAEP